MIRTDTVVLGSADGRPQDAYLARPAAGRATGLIVLHDMFGINPVFRDLADDYARQGLATVMPNLFWRAEVSGPLPYEGAHPAAWERIKHFDPDAATADIGRAAAWLRGQAWYNGKVAVLGFCFSGKLAVLAAAHARIDAAFSFYGLGISERLADLRQVKCPLQLHYGMNDEHVKRPEIDTIAAAAADNNRIAVYLYPGAGHSFFNKVRPTYDAAASQLAAQRVDRALQALTE